MVIEFDEHMKGYGPYQIRTVFSQKKSYGYHRLTSFNHNNLQCGSMALAKSDVTCHGSNQVPQPALLVPTLHFTQNGS